MNILFAVVFLAAAAVFLVSDPNGFLTAMLTGGQRAATLCLSLAAVYCVWLGFFNVLQQSGLAARLSRRLYPAARRLFRSDDREAVSLACQNIAANMLGLPGAPTPPGAAAAHRFCAAKNDFAADMLFVLNATGLQLLPTTVIAIRSAAGSAAPADIVLPTLLAALTSTAVGVFLIVLTRRRRT